jgi:hypothetical protein
MEIVFKEARKKDGDIVSVPVLELDEGEYYDLESDYSGFCLGCGEIASGVEPDASGYRCECCDANRVCGLEQGVLMGRVRIV